MSMFFQIIGILASTLLLVAFVAPIPVGGIINSGNLVGILLSALLLFYAVFYRRIHRWVGIAWKGLAGRIFLTVIAIGTAAFLLFTLYTGVRMVLTLKNAPKGTETVIVLGCQVRADGPSLMLWERIDAATAYLKAHPDAACILSGGQGADEPMSEAECMRKELVARGIPAERLIKEDASTSTRENLEFSRRIIEEKRLNPSVALVTNNFHMYRAAKIAREMGIDSTAIPAKTMLVLFPTYALREVLGVLYTFIF